MIRRALTRRRLNATTAAYLAARRLYRTGYYSTAALDAQGDRIDVMSRRELRRWTRWAGMLADHRDDVQPPTVGVIYSSPNDRVNGEPLGTHEAPYHNTEVDALVVTPVIQLHGGKPGTLDEWWVITHRPTGRQVGPYEFRSVDQATEAAAAVGDLVPWSDIESPSDIDALEPEALKSVKVVLRAACDRRR